MAAVVAKQLLVAAESTELNLLMGPPLELTSGKEAQEVLPRSVRKLANVDRNLGKCPIFTGTLHSQLGQLVVLCIQSDVVRDIRNALMDSMSAKPPKDQVPPTNVWGRIILFGAHLKAMRSDVE